jgi:TorA maturation chaperone TorD
MPFVLAMIVALAGAGTAPVQAEENEKLAQILDELARGLESEQQDAAIRRAFTTALDREPTDTELRRYRTIMHEDHWSEQDVLDDLRSRGDYQRHSTPGAGVDPDRVIRRAYEDVLNREPDGNGLRHYRTLMVDQGWTEQDVRQDLRKSTEHMNQGQDSAERIVRRAYRDILGREPDYNGLVHYRNLVMHQGWDQHDVERDILMSPEYRQKNAMARDNAVKIVNRAYRSILNREPDPTGLEHYVDKVLRQHWSEDNVASDLRHSDEYRKKHR